MVCIANEENNKFRKEEKEPPPEKKIFRENKITCGQEKRIDFRIFDFSFKEVIFQLLGRKQQHNRQKKVPDIFMKYRMA